MARVSASAAAAAARSASCRSSGACSCRVRASMGRAPSRRWRLPPRGNADPPPRRHRSDGQAGRGRNRRSPRTGPPRRRPRRARRTGPGPGRPRPGPAAGRTTEPRSSWTSAQGGVTNTISSGQARQPAPDRASREVRRRSRQESWSPPRTSSGSRGLHLHHADRLRQESDRVPGQESDADDYVTRLFGPRTRFLARAGRPAPRQCGRARGFPNQHRRRGPDGIRSTQPAADPARSAATARSRSSALSGGYRGLSLMCGCRVDRAVVVSPGLSFTCLVLPACGWPSLAARRARSTVSAITRGCLVAWRGSSGQVSAMAAAQRAQSRTSR